MAEIFLRDMLTKSLGMGSGGRTLCTGRGGLDAGASETDMEQSVRDSHGRRRTDNWLEKERNQGFMSVTLFSRVQV